MSHALASHRLQPRRAQRSQWRLFLIFLSIAVALLAAVLATEWWSGPIDFFRNASRTAKPFSGVGVIQLAPDGQELCQRLRLDNTSGAITADSLVRCDDLAFAPPPPPANTSHPRLEKIRRHFNPRQLP
jgi:hypothetical protein